MNLSLKTNVDPMRPFLIGILSLFPLLLFSQIRIGNCGKWRYIRLDRDTITTTCPGDGKSDWKFFRFEPGGSPPFIVVTDTFGNLELVRPFMHANFEDFKPGFYRVYGLYYPFSHPFIKGKNIFRDTMGTFCYGFTENFVLISNNAPEAGEISLVRGNISHLNCPDPQADMLLQFGTNSTFPSYTYLLTNAAGLIVRVNKEGKFQFRDLPSGKYLVHGLAYSGDLLAQPGNHLNADPLSRTCFTLTAKPLELERRVAQGGQIALEESQQSRRYFCTQFTNEDTLRLTHSGDRYLSYSFLVVDRQQIIRGVEKIPAFRLDRYPTGTYQVYGFSHLGGLPNIIGEKLEPTLAKLSCSSLSSNSLEVLIENIQLADFRSLRAKGDSIWCVNAPTTLRLSAVASGSENVSLIWLASNLAGQILAINRNPDSIPIGSFEDDLIQFHALAYTGFLKWKPGDNLRMTVASDGCFTLSPQTYTIRKKRVTGGTVRFSTFNQPINICLGTEQGYTLQVNRTQALGERYIYLIVNSRNEIIQTSVNGFFNIGQLGVGSFSVRGLSYTGSLAFGAGSSIDTTVFSNECYILSENSLPFQKTVTQGGTIAFADGSNQIRTCKGTLNSSFELKNSSLITQKYAYALTDASGRIFQIEKGNSLVLRDSSLLLYQITGIAYSGDLTAKVGDHILARNLSSGCHSLSTNKLSILLEDVNAGTLQPQVITECLPPSASKSLKINLTGSTGAYSWILCDSLNRFVSRQSSQNPQLHRGLPNRLRIYGMASLGTPVFEVGKSIFQQDPGIPCFEITSNFQEVNWSETDGGAISLRGQTNLTVCTSNELEPLQMSSTSLAEGDEYLYLVVDTDNRLVATSSSGVIPLRTLRSGNYTIHGFSYFGKLQLTVGDRLPASNAGSVCSSWSSNTVRLEVIETRMGRISFSDGKESVQVCAQKTIQSLRLSPLSGNDSRKTFVLTGENGTILSTFMGPNLPGLDSFPDLILRIYGLAYTGTLRASRNAPITTHRLSDGCYQVSENFLTINRGNLSRGIVGLVNGQGQLQICPTDSLANQVTFRKLGFQGQAFVYLITNSRDLILDTTSQSTYDFNKQGIGDYRVHGLAFNGALQVKIGTPLSDPSLAEECFGLSLNFVSVAKRGPIAGFLVTEDGSTLLQNCPSDANFAIRSLRTVGSNGGSQVFVVLDAQEKIVQILTQPLFFPYQFPAGKYRMLSIAYNGTLALNKGEVWGSNAPSASCFAISGNEVRFLNIEPLGGRIKIVSGDTSNLCVGYGIVARIRFGRDSSNELSYSYVVTDTSDRYLGHFTDREDLDFERFSQGVVRVRGLSHTGKITLNQGVVLTGAKASEGCFQWSSNVIPIRLNQFRNHNVTSTLGSDSLLICTGDGQANPVTFSSGEPNPGTTYRYVLTTLTNNIVSILNSPTVDLENIGLREMRIYSVAHNGNFTAQVGQSITSSVLSTGCFRLSDNFIKISRDRPLAHRISFTNNDTIQQLCMTATGPFALLRTSFNGKTGYVYLVTDLADRVRMVSPSSNIPIGNLPDGDYRVYGLSYTGSLLVQLGDILRQDFIFATSCYRLSTNAVRFYKGGYAEGGRISSGFSNTLFTCPEDGMPDLIDISGPENPPETRYQLIITDTLDRLFYAPFDNQLINFNNTPTGSYRIYGVAYTGTLGWRIGQSLRSGSLVNVCHDLSENFISVFHGKPEGGRISKRDGSTGKTTIGVNNPLKDSLMLRVTEVRPAQVPYAFLLVGSDNRIVAISGSTIFLDTLKAGSYRIYGLASSNTMLIPKPGNRLTDFDKPGNCLVLSANFLDLDILPRSNLIAPTQVASQSQVSPAASFSYFPNPVTSILRISLYQKELGKEQGQIRLLDLSGRIIYRRDQEIHHGLQTAELDLSQLQPGIYLLMVRTGKQTFSGKLMKTGSY